MCEAEIIILAIEKYPCLWDIHDDDYFNRDVKELAWEKVFKEVIKEWDTCSQADQENKGKILYLILITTVPIFFILLSFYISIRYFPWRHCI